MTGNRSRETRSGSRNGRLRMRNGRLNCHKGKQRTTQLSTPHPVPLPDRGGEGVVLRSMCLFAANKVPRLRWIGFLLRSLCSFVDNKAALQK
jgi:hypothetical protein